MKFRLKRHIILCLLAVLSAIPASAASIKATLDSVTLLMGRTATIEVKIEEPESQSGKLLFLSRVKEGGFAGVCGDSVELGYPRNIDTVSQGHYRTISLKIPVQSFDSGAYRLPAFEYVSGKDTARSGELSLKVIPVPVRADTPIADYAGISDPENPSFFDWVPDWILDYWSILVLIAVAAGFMIWAITKYTKDGSLLPVAPAPKPYDKAMAEMRDLKERKLWEQGMEREFYTDLTRILREYLYGRFGINAMEMTSRQILAAVAKNKEAKDKRPYLRQILDMADFVKFAKVKPLADDNVAAYDNGLKFVKETKPVEEEPEENKNVKVGSVGKDNSPSGKISGGNKLKSLKKRKGVKNA